ncbi:unnamed protein product [Eruca vesicaria subsp. sativa]|uniref:Uncharacterized protein n=1 Tax=Eruca vesicaria subsp. sativa TaxID=29727 RepID=A0ABC8LJT8_ERUVS|nr:unnamed protein product [Eruca vesicaria subsp. sativa]
METMESYGSIENHESSKKKLTTELPSSPWNPLSSEKAGPWWWRTTNKDELASLVAQRSLYCVENCDLPTPQKMKRSYYSVSNQTSCKNRTELLEALRCSQTRAREAENMAKEEYEEKEKLVKLLFKQDSELFAYKQWLQLLQLEALYLQIKSKESENNKEPPVSIPWSNSKGRKRSKGNGLVGLALGMSLVGAGLLLGWTVGWMEMFSF